MVSYSLYSILIFMGRGGRSSSSSRGRATSPPPRQAPTASRPMPAQTPVQPQTQQKSGGLLSGIGSTIAQGMAFGAGSEIAHQAVRSFMGGSSTASQQKKKPPNSNSSSTRVHAKSRWTTSADVYQLTTA